MRLEQLKYLIEVANCKSINKAAQNLYITQPALSIAINSLEEELQYPLLKRTKKGVLLTEDGARVLQEAQMVLNTSRIGTWPNPSRNMNWMVWCIFRPFLLSAWLCPTP